MYSAVWIQYETLRVQNTSESVPRPIPEITEGQKQRALEQWACLDESEQIRIYKAIKQWMARREQESISIFG